MADQLREQTRHIKVRDVSWDEIVFPDDRKYLEIVCKDWLPSWDTRPLEQWCECGSHLAFVRAEAWMNQPETCCCGGCRVPMLMVIGACGGWCASDGPERSPCPYIGEEMAGVFEGEDVRLFFEPVPAPAERG
jgi:hypothetical protein